MTVSALILSSCSSGSWFGEKDKVPHPGKRESILILDKQLEVSKELQKIAISVPKQVPNNLWNVSGVNQNGVVPQNIALGKSLHKERDIRLTGSSYSGHFKRVAPIILNDKIYILNSSEVRAYDINSSKLLWAKMVGDQKSKRTFGGGLLAQGNVLYVTSGGKELAALDISDGNILWKYSLSNVSRSAPNIFGENLYVQTIDNKLYAIDRSKGSLLWFHQGPVEAINSMKYPSVFANQNIVVAAYGSGDIYFLAPQNGGEFLQIELANNSIIGQGVSLKNIESTPVVEGDRVFAINNEGVIICLDLTNGTTIWKQEIIGFKNMWLAGDFIYLLNPNGEIISIYKKTGKIKWVNHISFAKGDKPAISGPVMAGDRLLISFESGQILEISPYDGKVLNKLDAGARTSGFPIIVNEKLYSLTDSGNLVVFK